MKIIKNYINGSVKSYSSKYLNVIDPSTGEKSGEVVLSNSKDFDEVIKSSKNAFKYGLIQHPLKGLEL